MFKDWRGIALGSVLGVWIAAFTLFNDTLIRQPLMTGNLLPTSVFGLVVVLCLLTAVLGMRRRLLTQRDFAWVIILGTAACAWPGSNFLRTFVGITANPIYLQQTRPDWQAVDAMSYVPGGHPRLGETHLTGAVDFAQEITAAATPPSARLWEVIEPTERLALQRLISQPPTSDPQSAAERSERVRRVLNRVIDRAELYTPGVFDTTTLTPDAQELVRRSEAGGVSRAERQRLNRALLANTWPEHIRPTPPGSGAIIAHGQHVPRVMDPLLSGTTRAAMPWNNVPWGDWWPVLRLWVGVALLMGVLAICLALIVHPQWSQRELLTYPIVRFAEELLKPRPDVPHYRPQILTNRLFLLAFGAVMLLHLVNGLHEWFVQLPYLPLTYDLTALHQLFPTAATVTHSGSVFSVKLFLTAVAFAFFVRLDVSFSLGISSFVWVAVGTVLAGQGILLSNTQSEAHMGPSFRAGAYLGYLLIILYAGRRHYLHVASSALGLRRSEPGERLSTWAARLAVVAGAGSVFLMVRYGGLDWRLASMVVLLMVVMMVVLARIAAETGLFYAQPNWVPIVLLAALFGFEGLGPEAFVFIALASRILVGDPRESLMGFLVHGMRAGRRIGGFSLGPVSGGQLAMIVVSLVVAVVATLSLQYTMGLSKLETWANVWAPSDPFNSLTRELSQAGSVGKLQSMADQPVRHFADMAPDGDMLWIVVLGVVMVMVCAAGRLRLPRWPVHPVLFLVVGTTPAARFAWSFFVGWLLKLAIVKLGGTRGFQASLPLAIGVIAGELAAALAWQIVGIIYYAITGEIPTTYFILPN